MQNSEFDAGCSAFGVLLLLISPRPFASMPSSPILPPISPRRRVPVDRALIYGHPPACSRARSTPALLRSPVLVPASAHAQHWLLPTPPPRRPCPSIRGPFAPPFFSQRR